MRNLFFLFFFSFFLSSVGQEIGDSIIFTTKSGKDYRGILESKEQDGYFFKTSNNRIIYLSKSEIKEFQKIKKEILKESPSTKINPEFNGKENTFNKIITEDTNTSTKIDYSINQIYSLRNIENITIVLKDKRSFTGKILKIYWQNGSKIILFTTETRNYKFKEYEISEIYKSNQSFDYLKKNDLRVQKDTLNNFTFLFLSELALGDFQASTVGLKFCYFGEKAGFYTATSFGILDIFDPLLIVKGGLILPTRIMDSYIYFGYGKDLNYDENQIELGFIVVKKFTFNFGFRFNIDDPSWSAINLAIKKSR